MKNRILLILPLLILATACQEKSSEPLTAQQVVDSAIAVAGGDLYSASSVRFRFRDRMYNKSRDERGVLLIREQQTDSGVIRDVRTPAGFFRYRNDSLLTLADTTANKFSNAVNSVHYFAYLPYGLNDRAVNKKLLGTVDIGDESYYKVRVSFDQEGGGDDYEDVFVYWFNTKTYRPDYLAYEFHTNGGGLRFREGYNDREVGGIRFQDYLNYKPRSKVPVTALDSLFKAGQLDTLSKIELREISVSADNYN